MPREQFLNKLPGFRWCSFPHLGGGLGDIDGFIPNITVHDCLFGRVSARTEGAKAVKLSIMAGKLKSQAECLPPGLQRTMEVIFRCSCFAAMRTIKIVEMNRLKNQHRRCRQEERVAGAAQEAVWWLARAESWYSLSEAALQRESANLGCRLLQQVAEFCFKAVIRHHTGDHPFTRNPYTLLHIAALEMPSLRAVFPRISLKEIRLFALLNPYRFVPGHEPAVADREVLAELAGRVAQLLEMTGDLLDPGGES